MCGIIQRILKNKVTPETKIKFYKVIAYSAVPCLSHEQGVNKVTGGQMRLQRMANKMLYI